LALNEEFALSFDAYEHWESFDKCAEIANVAVARWDYAKELPLGLIDLKTCVFFEQRRFRHMDRVPTKEDMVYIHALVEAIRRTAAVKRRS